jgi:hypothetical protein
VTKFDWRGGRVRYTNARKKFRNAVLACVLLGKNFQNGVLAHSITKIPWFWDTLKNTEWYLVPPCFISSFHDRAIILNGHLIFV